MLTDGEYWSNAHRWGSIGVMLTDGEYWSNAHREGVLE